MASASPSAPIAGYHVAPLRAGQKVRVYYTGPREKRVVQRVIVED